MGFENRGDLDTHRQPQDSITPSPRNARVLTSLVDPFLPATLATSGICFLYAWPFPERPPDGIVSLIALLVASST